MTIQQLKTKFATISIEQLKTDLLDLLDDLKSVDTYTEQEKEIIKAKIFFLSSALQQLELYNKL